MSARFPTSELLRRLGYDAPHAMTLGGGAAVPTMQVLDLSRSVASEPVEARAVVTAQAPGFAGIHSIVELHSRTPGGMIVERLFPIEPVTLNGWWLQIDGSAVLAGPPGQGGAVGASSFLNIGGVRARAVYAIGAGDFPPSPSGGAGCVWGPGQFDDIRIYVPNGQLLRTGPRNINTAFEVAIVFRELGDFQTR